MIAKLFYPRELKRAIMHLRENHDLNEHALTAIEKQLFWPILIFILMIMAIVIMDYPPIFFAYSFMVFLLLCLTVIRGVIRYWVLPFSFGEPILAIIKKAYIKKNATEAPKSWFITCSFENKNNRTIIKDFRIPEFEKTFLKEPKTGQTITVFLHPSNEKIYALGAEKRLQNYCLSASRLKESTEA